MMNAKVCYKQLLFEFSSIIWAILYMVHIIWSMLYGPYYMDHIIGSIWVLGQRFSWLNYIAIQRKNDVRNLRYRPVIKSLFWVTQKIAILRKY